MHMLQGGTHLIIPDFCPKVRTSPGKSQFEKIEARKDDENHPVCCLDELSANAEFCSDAENSEMAIRIFFGTSVKREESASPSIMTRTLLSMLSKLQPICFLSPFFDGALFPRSCCYLRRKERLTLLKMLQLSAAVLFVKTHSSSFMTVSSSQCRLFSIAQRERMVFAMSSTSLSVER